MKQRCGGLLPLLAVMLVLSACSIGRPVGQTSPSPHPPSAAPTADPARCDRLAKRGFTPCPPTADKMQLPPTTIRNATNGAVSDATAQQWGRAFQLTEAYYRWALQANARDALTKGVLADPGTNSVANLFGTDLMDLDEATRQSGRLVVEPLQFPSVQVVTVPHDLQQAMQRQGLTPSDFGLAVRFIGPGRRAIRHTDGTEIVVVSTGADYSASLLLWGQFKTDPDLGAIWYEFGNYGCDGVVRAVCQV